MGEQSSSWIPVGKGTSLSKLHSNAFSRWTMEKEFISDQRGCSGRIPSWWEVVQTSFSLTGWEAVWQTQSDQRAMRFPAKRGEYKHPGTTSSAIGTEALCTDSGRQACSCQVRQYISNLSHQPSRGHEIQPVYSSITGAVDLGLPSVCEYQSHAHPRSDKCSGRFLVMPQTSVGGVESQPRGGGYDMAVVWQSRSRSICLSNVGSVPPLVFTSRRIHSSGAGCFSPRLSRSVTVCLSRDTIDLSNCSQSPSGIPQATSSGTELARETLVSNDVQALEGSPGAFSSTSWEARFDTRIQTVYSSVFGLWRARITFESLWSGCTEHYNEF